MEVDCGGLFTVRLKADTYRLLEDWLSSIHKCQKDINEHRYITMKAVEKVQQKQRSMGKTKSTKGFQDNISLNSKFSTPYQTQRNWDAKSMNVQKKKVLEEGMKPKMRESETKFDIVKPSYGNKVPSQGLRIRQKMQSFEASAIP